LSITEAISRRKNGIGKSDVGRRGLAFWPAAKRADQTLHPLGLAISRLGTQLWGTWVAFGALRAAGVVLAAGFLLGLMDSFLRINEVVFRFILSSSWLLAAGASLCVLVVRRFFSRPTEVQIARLLEWRYPQLRDQLAAATEFACASGTNSGRGSPELQQAVVSFTWEAFQRLQLHPLVVPRLWWQNGGLLAATLGLLLVCLLLWPSMVLTGTLRLLLPWQDIRWPQRYHLLILRSVSEVVQGGDFEIELVDREGKRLPAGGKVWFKTATPDGRVVLESMPLTYLDPETAARRLNRPNDPLLRGGVWIARREAVESPFWFRAEAGDDHSMPWFYVRTAAAPALRSLSGRVSPPPYTGWPEMEFSGPVAALEGSRILFRGESTKPLAEGTLVTEKQGSFPLRLEDAIHFSVELLARQTTSFWFRLIDKSGLGGGDTERWELRVFPDGPPRVSVRPMSSLSRVTPKARFRVLIDAGDDVGLREVQLHLSRKEGESSAVLAVYRGSPFPPRPGEDFVARGPAAENRSVGYDVDLAELNLSPGERLTLTAKAQDYRGQWAESSPVLLEVVTPEELRALLADQERTLLADLRRALEVQENARRLAGQERNILLSVASSPGELGSGLESTLWTQREVPRILTDSSESVAERAEALLATLTQNRLEDPELSDRLKDLRDKLGELKAHPLPVCEEGILAAKRAMDWVKAANLDPPTLLAKRQEASEHLGKVLDCQQIVIDTLEELIARFHVSDSLRELRQELSEVLRSQWEVHRRSLEQARNTAGRTLEGLSPPERAALQSLAEEQRRVGEGFQRFSKALREWVAHFPAGQSPPESIAEAVQLANKIEGRGVIPKTAVDLAENRMGQALRQQQEVLADLDQLAGLLQEDQSQASRLLPKIPPELAKNLRKLLEDQRTVRQKFAEAASSAPPAGVENLAEAARRQQALRSQLEAFGHQLSPEVQSQVGPKLETAGREMAAAVSKAEEKQALQALEHAQTAEKLLGELYEELAGDSTDQLLAAAERMMHLYRELVTLAQAQKELAEQTADFHRRVTNQGELSRRDLLRILALADRQQYLAVATEQLPLPPEARLLRSTQTQVREALEQAEQGLRNRDTGPPTQQAQRRALTLLEQMIAALTPPESSSQSESTQQTPTSPTSEGSPAEKDQLASNPYLLIELRLLRNLQEGLKAETEEFFRVHGKGETLPEEARQWAERLRSEQEHLSQLLIELLKSAIDPTIQLPAKESESLP